MAGCVGSVAIWRANPVSKSPTGPIESVHRPIALGGNRTPEAVFLIVVDTLRADRLSCYGYDKVRTPNIDELAARGVKFERAQTVASWTRPSMGAMLTSLYPRQLGFLEQPVPPGTVLEWRKRRIQLVTRLQSHARTAAEMFATAGFDTGAFVNQPALNATTSFGRGFSDYYYPKTGGGIVRQGDENKTFQLQEWGTLKEAYAIDAALIEQLKVWLKDRPDKKVFVWLHLLTPHRPYLPVPPFNPPAPEGLEVASDSVRYDAEIRGVDALVGEAIHAIEQYAGLERSLIVFTSDHGEEFDDHGHREHGHTLHREVTRIPLIMTAPSLLPIRTVESDVRIIDILPTMLAMSGVTKPTDYVMEGVSLVDMIASHRDPLPVFCEGMLYGSTERTLTSGGFKLMYDEQGEIYTLFDIMADPTEMKDVAPAKKSIVSSMAKDLRGWQTRLGFDLRMRASQ